MSGIVGIYNLNQQPVEADDLRRMVDVLAHRGPDGSDSWCSGAVGLGHRMLWTTPESLSEKLPLVKAGLTITADARIDNRDELIATLGLAARSDETLADSEIILAAYQKWGEDCCDKLLGDFSFVVWDTQAQKLFCARDHFGVKPFYYHASALLFAFATEIKAILCLPEVPRTLNETRIADYLMGMFDDTASTSYTEIKRLPPAHKMTVCAEGVEIAPYWSLDPDYEHPPASNEDYAREFRKIFKEAVRCRLRSAYPMGTTLSGGLDSSSITCMATDLLAKDRRPPLHSFSAVFDDIPECDERIYIEAVLKRGEIVSHYMQGNQQSPLERIDEMLWHQDEAFYAPNWSMNWPIYEEARRQGVRVILDGYDGDTTVSDGYGYLTELARAKRWILLTKEVRELCKTFSVPFWPMMRSYLRQYVVEPASSSNHLLRGLRTAWQRISSFNRRNKQTQSADALRWQTLLNRNFIEVEKLSERHKAWRKTQGNAGLDERERHYRNIVSQGLPAFALEMMDRSMAAFNVEPRYPFWDKRLVEFCLALPADQKLKSGWNRVIMRRAMDNILPVEVQWRRGKTDFSTNLSLGLTAKLPQMKEAMTHVDLLVDYVDEATVAKIYQRFLTEPTSRDARQLWIVLSLAAWMHHIKKQGNPNSSTIPSYEASVVG